MPSHPAVPPLLSPYISNFPTPSLTLLTSTVGATANWLVLRILHVALLPASSGSDDGGSLQTRVILVSWLRDTSFWKDGGRKLGQNFQKVHIIDALSNGLGLQPRGLADVERTVLEAIKPSNEDAGGGGKTLLILDGLDFLLAATSCSANAILEMLGEFREHVSAIVITASVGLALTQSQNTPLEISHASFVMSLAHQARMIMSVKGLETGVAKDISGVLNISRGPGTDGADEEVEEKEWLYHVESDGGVGIFERGA